MGWTGLEHDEPLTEWAGRLLDLVVEGVETFRPEDIVAELEAALQNLRWDCMSDAEFEAACAGPSEDDAREKHRQAAATRLAEERKP